MKKLDMGHFSYISGLIVILLSFSISTSFAQGIRKPTIEISDINQNKGEIGL